MSGFCTLAERCALCATCRPTNRKAAVEIPTTATPRHTRASSCHIGKAHDRGTSPRSGTAGAIRHAIGSRQRRTLPPSVERTRGPQRGNPRPVTVRQRPSGTSRPNGMRLPSQGGVRPDDHQTTGMEVTT